MLANRIINILTSLLSPVVIPIQLVTTFVGGCLVSFTFGLLLLPLSLVWVVVFMGPLLGMSWLWDRAPLLRLPVGVLGVPLAVLGGVYVSLVPSMGELDSRAVKLLVCWTWPFSLDYMRYRTAPDQLDFERWQRLQKALEWNRAVEAQASQPPPL